MSQAEARSHVLEHDGHTDKKRKRTKRGMGKACVYCRRSHMVCEGGRPCERCIKRDISHLCRDFSPPRRQSTPHERDHSHPHSSSHAGPSRTALSHGDADASSAFALDDTDGDGKGSGANGTGSTTVNGTGNGTGNGMNRTYSGQLTSIDPSQLNSNLPLYSDPNFAPAWPLLPDASGSMGMGAGGDGWMGDDQTELGALSKYLGDLGVPNLPGGFLDVLTYFTKGGSGSGTGTNSANGLAGGGGGGGSAGSGGLGEIRNLPIAGVAETGMGMGLGTGSGGSGTGSGVQTPRISGLEGTNFADLTGSAGLGLGEDGVDMGSALGGRVFPPLDMSGEGGEGEGRGEVRDQDAAKQGQGGARLGGASGAGTSAGAGVSGLQVPPASGTAKTAPNPTAAASAAMTRDNSGRASGAATATAKGKGKEVVPLGNLSRIERYFLAAADQPSGPRSSRLSQVIKAKYDAGLLRPYDYVKGYERMKEWMDSGRAAPRVESAAPSAPGSPTKFGASLTAANSGATAHTKGTGLKPLTSANTGTGTGTPGTETATGVAGGIAGAGARGEGKNDNANISPDGRRRIWAAMNGFRPKFRQIARTLTEVDLVFIEEAMERWMLQYDRAFASIHTPSCIWRRTGEIQKANQEFANLTGIPASMFRNGQLCVYELMDEASAVRYWEGYAKIAFDAGQRSLYISCTLRIPTSLTRLPPRMPYATPTLLAAPKTAASGPGIIPGISAGAMASASAMAGAQSSAGAGAGASTSNASRSMSIPDLQLPQSLVQMANGTAVGQGEAGTAGTAGTAGMPGRGDGADGGVGGVGADKGTVGTGAGAAVGLTAGGVVNDAASAPAPSSASASATAGSAPPASNTARDRAREPDTSPAPLVPGPNNTNSASAARSRIQGTATGTGTGMANTNANTALSTNATLGAGPKKETYREIKCCFSVTIRRDAWGVPVAIMGQWIPI